jgi:hypothetical protein
MGTTETTDFTLIVKEVSDLQTTLSLSFRAEVEGLQQESQAISRLMSAARDLSEPQPSFFTRG